MSPYCVGCKFQISQSSVAVTLKPAQVANLCHALDSDPSQIEFQYDATLCRDCFPLMSASLIEGMKSGGKGKRVTIALTGFRSNAPVSGYLVTPAGDHYYLKMDSSSSTYYKGLAFFLPLDLRHLAYGTGTLHIFQFDDVKRDKVKETIKRIAWAEDCDNIGPNGWPMDEKWRWMRLDRDRVLGDVAERLKVFASTKDMKDAPNSVPFMFLSKGKWNQGHFRPDRRFPECEILEHKFSEVYAFQKNLPKDMLWIPVDELILRWRQVKTLSRVVNRHWDAIHSRLWAPPDALMARRGWEKVKDLFKVNDLFSH